VTNGAGNIVCAGGQTGCVPINIFTSNSLTPAMTNYISGTGEKEGSATEQVVSADITGDSAATV